ncbi:hypothetical protein FG078_18280 [Vibrio cholerae]|nr:hypothetical protein [Vibrio cholerae]EGR0510735.1 hypothetical protein [Vibrio cholerae]
MGCFRHFQEPAICICKNCGVFLCEKCAISSGEGFVCSALCHEHIDKIEKHNQQNIEILQANIISSSAVIAELTGARKGYRALINLYILIALLIIATGIDRGDYNYSMTFILILIVLIGFSFFRLKSIQSALDRLSSHNNKRFKEDSQR